MERMPNHLLSTIGTEWPGFTLVRFRSNQRPPIGARGNQEAQAPGSPRTGVMLGQ